MKVLKNHSQPTQPNMFLSSMQLLIKFSSSHVVNQTSLQTHLRIHTHSPVLPKSSFPEHQKEPGVTWATKTGKCWKSEAFDSLVYCAALSNISEWVWEKRNVVAMWVWRCERKPNRPPRLCTVRSTATGAQRAALRTYGASLGVFQVFQEHLRVNYFLYQQGNASIVHMVWQPCV